MDTLNQEAMLENSSDMENMYLTFMLAEVEYGIEIKYVTEIVSMQSITPMPELPHYVKGIINLRGKIIPIIDMHLRFGMEEAPYGDRTCIVVVMIRESMVGLIVDTVCEVTTIEDVSAPPTQGDGNMDDYMQGIGKCPSGVKLLLDCQKLLSEEEYSSLAGL